MTDDLTDTNRPTGLVLSRPRWAFLAVGVAGFVAAVVCMVMSHRAGWTAYVPYWGAPMQNIPANDAAKGWLIAAMGSWLVGGTVAACALMPRRMVPAMALGAVLVTGVTLGIMAIA
jgi:heme/copper-type cytochrome/quinol oxidase subunit 1